MNTKLLPLVALAAALPASLPAITIAPGSFFNVTATLTVTNAANPTITFSNLAVNNQVVGIPPEGGTFGTGAGQVNLNGQTITVNSLTASSQPVGTIFSDPNWVQFLAADLLPSLTLTFIPAGIDGAAGCTATPPAVGQLCTPTVGGNPGPFNFQNTNSGSTASFGFSGLTSDNADTFIANFTSQFTTNYQTELAMLASSGSVSNSVSGTFTFAAAPEPGSLTMIGAGLLGLAAVIRRRASK